MNGKKCQKFLECYLKFSRLIAQIHDELLFEVEDSQIQEFSGKCHLSLFSTTSFFPPITCDFSENIELM